LFLKITYHQVSDIEVNILDNLSQTKIDLWRIAYYVLLLSVSMQTYLQWNLYKPNPHGTNFSFRNRHMFSLYRLNCWPLCCLFFFYVWLLITPLVSSNFWCNEYTHFLKEILNQVSNVICFHWNLTVVIDMLKLRDLEIVNKDIQRRLWTIQDDDC